MKEVERDKTVYLDRSPFFRLSTERGPEYRIKILTLETDGARIGQIGKSEETLLVPTVGKEVRSIGTHISNGNGGFQ